MSNFTRIFAAAAIASVAVVGLSACSTPAPNDNKGIINPVTAPITVDMPSQLADKTQELKVGQVLNINSVSPADWDGLAAKPGIVSFTPGGTSGGSVSNFGFTGVAEGSTDVQIVNRVSGETYTFTIKVVK